MASVAVSSPIQRCSCYTAVPAFLPLTTFKKRSPVRIQIPGASFDAAPSPESLQGLNRDAGTPPNGPSGSHPLVGYDTRQVGARTQLKKFWLPIRKLELAQSIVLYRLIITVVLVALAAASLLYPPIRATLGNWIAAPRELLQSAPGFIESFTLIFMSEIGDKTFFIAALLAMKLGRTVAFLGSVASLGLMTIVSVGIGRAFAQIPQFVDQSAVWGQYVGAAFLLYFGIRTLSAGLRAKKEDSDEELEEAKEEMQEAERSGRIKGSTWASAFWETASLIFIAEWGDRSMLATIALAIKSNPVGVASGAALGHTVATLIAVTAGSLASKYISEKVVQIIGGSLFIVFAVETGFGMGLL